MNRTKMEYIAQRIVATYAELDVVSTTHDSRDTLAKISAGQYVEPAALRSLERQIPSNISGASCRVCGNICIVNVDIVLDLCLSFFLG